MLGRLAALLCVLCDLAACRTLACAAEARPPAADKVTCQFRQVLGRSIDLRNPDWIERWKDKRWMGFNEYCAYLHGRVDVAEAGGLRVQFYYDPYYCRHFAKHSSRWTLELSDWYRAKLGGKVSLDVDGQAESRILAGQQAIVIPAGVGEKNVVIRPQ